MSENTGVVVSEPITDGDVLQEVSVIVQKKMAIGGIDEKTINELRERAAKVTIESLETADGQKEARAVTKALSKLSTKVETICDQGSLAARQEHKAWVFNKNSFTATIKQIAAGPKKLLDAWNAKKEQQEQAELQKQEQAIRARFLAVEEMGFKRMTETDTMPDRYVLGETSIAVFNISTSEGPEWDNLLRSMRVVSEEARAEEEMAQAIAQEAALEREKEQQELAQAREIIAASVGKVRLAELVEIGCEVRDGHVGVFDETDGNSTVRVEDLHLRDADSWDADKAHFLQEVHDQRARVACAGVNASRLAEMVAAGLDEERYREASSQFYTYDDQQWGHYLQAAKDYETQLDRDKSISLSKTALEGAGWTVYKEEIDGLLYLHVMMVHESAQDGHWDELMLWNDHESIGRNIRLGEKCREETAQRIIDEAVAAANVPPPEEDEAPPTEDALMKATGMRAEVSGSASTTSDLEAWNQWMVDIKQSAPALSGAMAIQARDHLLKHIVDYDSPRLHKDIG